MCRNYGAQFKNLCFILFLYKFEENLNIYISMSITIVAAKALLHKW